MEEHNDKIVEICFAALDYTESFIFKSFKYVIPYYIIKTVDNNHEGEIEIGYFFGAHAFGSLIGGQIVILSHYFESNILCNDWICIDILARFQYIIIPHLYVFGRNVIL